MSNLTIIGSGPRGLSIALLAIERGHSVTLLDPSPLTSWTPPNMIDDLEMRSPSTFDLFTFLPDMDDFRLSTYMGISSRASTQQEVEEDEVKVTRDTFLQYLKSIFREVIRDAVLYKEEVIKIEGQKVHTRDRVIESDHIVLSTGSCSNKEMPLWLRQMGLENICRPLTSLVKNPPEGQHITVVGSGQGAAEVTEFLSRNNFVYWVVNKNLRVNQYPAPSWTSWGPRTALGPFYRRIENWESRFQYMGSMKAWQPSITPYIWQKLLSNKDRWEMIKAETTSDLDKALSNSSIISIQIGVKPSVKLLPIEGIEVYPFLPEFPKLSYGFTTSNERLHITGMLAIPYDGPRQASLISAGTTSKEILDRIENYD